MTSVVFLIKKTKQNFSYLHKISWYFKCLIIVYSNFRASESSQDNTLKAQQKSMQVC